jgi:hypothetical protein
MPLDRKGFMRTYPRPALLLAYLALGWLVACGGVKPITVVERETLLRGRWLGDVSDPETGPFRALLHQGWHERDKLVFWYLPALDGPMDEDVRFQVRSSDPFAPWCAPTVTASRVPDFRAVRYELQNPSTAPCQPFAAGASYEVTARLPGSRSNERRFSVHTVPSEDSTSPFSFLVFSCVEPFATETQKTPIRYVNSFNLFQMRASGVWSPKGLPTQPAFALGLGDQIYVDAGPKPTEPIALFHEDRSDALAFHLNETDANLELFYRYHLAIPPLDKAFQSLPTMMMWDDHEIRDGWGSQGDEKTGHWPRYFERAKAAFHAYEAQRNPGYSPGMNAADFEFRHGKQVKALVLDTRSCRSITPSDERKGTEPIESNALCEESRTRLEKWLEVDPASPPTLYILGLGTVFSMNETWRARIDQRVFAEHVDDLADGWGSTAMKKERRQLVEALEKHFTQRPEDRLLVLSGDIHESGVVFLTLKDSAGKERIFGHEVISSGLAADKMDIKYLAYLAAESGTLSERMYSRVAATMRAANFAEISINPRGADKAPRANVVFYPSAQYKKGSGLQLLLGERMRLANPAGLVSSLTKDQAPEVLKTPPYATSGNNLGVSIVELVDEPEYIPSLSLKSNMLHFSSTLCWVPKAVDPNAPADDSWAPPNVNPAECDTK